MLFSYLVPSQLILKHANTLDILIHQIVYMEHFDNILQNFEKLFGCRKLELSSIKFFDKNCILKVLENIPCEQFDVSGCLVYRHIFSSHAICRADPPPWLWLNTVICWQSWFCVINCLSNKLSQLWDNFRFVYTPFTGAFLLTKLVMIFYFFIHSFITL